MSEHHKVRVHIDQKVHETNTPTTGEHLYKIGEVAAHRALFKVITGNHEDEHIDRDEKEIHCNQDDHFYSQKEITIIVNAEKKKTTHTSLSYWEVVELAFHPVPKGPNVLFTIAYRHGPKKNREGTLTEHHYVVIKEGMIFNVTQTDKS